MASLLCDGRVVAPLEVADTFGARLKGLLGRDGLEGALLITRSSSVHTIGMQFPIDVAFCDPDMIVVGTVTMQPNRMSLPRRRSRTIVEAPAGAFEQWDVSRGCKLEVRV